MGLIKKVTKFLETLLTEKYAVIYSRPMCHNCPGRDGCSVLCDDMERVVKMKSSRDISVDIERTTKPLFISESFSEEQGREYRLYAVALLNAEQQKVLGMVSEGLKQIEIARKLGISAPAVSRRMARIRKSINRGTVRFMQRLFEGIAEKRGYIDVGMKTSKPVVSGKGNDRNNTN